jgi:hypothetical protein
MEISESSFSLRGADGLVKVASNSVFDLDLEGVPGAYTEESECDVLVESSGFLVNKAIILSMPSILSFLREIRAAIARGEGRARLGHHGDAFALDFVCEGGRARVECSMNDSMEGKENSASLTYAIEPDFLIALKRELEKLGSSARKVD